MIANTNRQIVLAARPVGPPKETNFRLVERPVPMPAEGELLVRTIWLSLDPYMRLRMGTDLRYYPPIPLGDVIVGGAVSRVVESRHPKFAPGDIVDDYTGWQDYAIAQGASARKVNPALGPLSTAVGVLGMPGLTAYLGLVKVGRPAPGDTVVISAASGAVGAVAGQVAKIAGCRVVGIAGGAEKLRYLTQELGFDEAIDRHTGDLPGALAAACPDGIDVYFENVGGPIGDAIYPLLAHGARVVICGGISHYNATEPPQGREPPRADPLHRDRGEGLQHLLLRRALRARAQAPRPLAGGRPARLQGGHRGRPRERADGVSALLRRTQLRQAAGQGLGGVVGSPPVTAIRGRGRGPGPPGCRPAPAGRYRDRGEKRTCARAPRARRR